KISCPAPPPTAPWPSNTYPMTPRCDQGGGIAMSGVITTTYDGTNYVPSHVNLKDVTDGSSHTFVVGEISWMVGPQRIWAVGTATRPDKNVQDSYNYSSKNVMNPLNYAYRADTTINQQPCANCENNDLSFGSMHPGGTHFVMCDGSVQFISDDVPIAVLRALASRKSGDSTEGAF